MAKWFLDLLKKALVLALGYVLLLVIGLVVLWFSLRALEPEPEKIEPDSFLVIDLNMNIPDTPSRQDLQATLQEMSGGGSRRVFHLRELLDTVETAAEDDRVGGIFLHGSLTPRGYGAGFAALAELRSALRDFQNAGKPVYGYLTRPGLRELYLLSIADPLYLHPYAEVDLSGLAVNSPFFAEALERAGIEVNAFRAGTYKNSLEPLTKKQFSEESREQLQALLGGLWEEILGTIAGARKPDPEAIPGGGLGGSGIYPAEAAAKAGLVDGLLYFDEVIAKLRGQTGANGESAGDLPQVGLRRYMETRSHENNAGTGAAEAATTKPEVAVVYAEGNIVNGRGTTETVGGDWLARELRALRRDDKVRGVVLRINTPGGSARASEIIHREVSLLAEQKPVVASFGTIAASGGYWIAAPTDTIFLQPLSVTGSIGVFGLTFHVHEAGGKLGIGFDHVTTGPFADLGTPTRPMDEAGKEIFRSFIDRLHEDFIKRVAEGRGLSREKSAELANGRVHTGKKALQLGLADELGGLGDAIDAAATAAGLETDAYSVRQVPDKRPLLENLLRNLQDSHKEDELAAAPRPSPDVANPWIRRIESLAEAVRSGKQAKARLPYDLFFDR